MLCLIPNNNKVTSADIGWVFFVNNLSTLLLEEQTVFYDTIDKCFFVA